MHAGIPKLSWIIVSLTSHKTILNCFIRQSTKSAVRNDCLYYILVILNLFQDPTKHILLGWKPQPTIYRTIGLLIAALTTLQTVQSAAMTDY
ncbi:TPA: hypothetical protein CPT80_02710 [Candidatus Gastranaerophilales bacterium HUM_9]|nr:MAG TPA: hypothetical protein CPT80_02710 [Candidatus Gastranaerophilales bacterium HUM_9]HBX34774.1 hypothetical protein [Cyanobacteria bacterium UBA11440]